MLAWGLAALLGASGSPAALAGSAPEEYQVKAAFLFNFVRFVEWPANTLGAGDPLTLCVFGQDPFGTNLDQIVSGKTANGKPLVIRRISDPSALRGCQIVFLAASEMRRFDAMAGALADLSVLTVGEAKGFAERGGVINLVVQDEHVRFEINPAAAARARLRISSKLLQLALLVGGRPEAK